jgi:hypothetical protein
VLSEKLTQSDGTRNALVDEYRMLEIRARVLNQRERNSTLVIKRD